MLLAQGKFADASSEFQTALRIYRDFATAHFGLGAAQLNLGQTDDAIAQFTEALRIDPSLAPAKDALNKAVSLKRGR